MKIKTVIDATAKSVHVSTWSSSLSVITTDDSEIDVKLTVELAKKLLKSLTSFIREEGQKTIEAARELESTE